MNTRIVNMLESLYVMLNVGKQKRIERDCSSKLLSNTNMRRYFIKFYILPPSVKNVIF